MSYHQKENRIAARLSANGFAFSVRHAFAPIIERGQAWLDDYNTRSLRRRAQQEIDELPDYLRQDIGITGPANPLKHNKV